MSAFTLQVLLGIALVNLALVGLIAIVAKYFRDYF